MGIEQGGAAPPPGAGLQFDKVEHAASAAAPFCAACRRPLQEYFEVNGQMICRICAGALAAPPGSAAMFRAVAAGAGAAVLGTLVWYGILVASEAQWGIVGIAIGLFVGWAVRKGSGGQGGWQYQALAMALTYMSIAASWIPILIKMAQAENIIFVGFADYAAAFVTSLVRPFVDGSVMGWIIMGIALYEAWKLNRRVPVSGPFRLATPGAT
jgi:hypothetical protein